MAYMTTAHYHDNNRDMTLEYDRRAIIWLQEHVVGSPVIAEANTPLYRWGNRISIYTGPAHDHRLGLAPEAAARRGQRRGGRLAPTGPA